MGHMEHIEFRGEREKDDTVTSLEYGMMVDLCWWRLEVLRCGLIMLKPAIALAIIVE